MHGAQISGSGSTGRANSASLHARIVPDGSVELVEQVLEKSSGHRPLDQVAPAMLHQSLGESGVFSPVCRSPVANVNIGIAESRLRFGDEQPSVIRPNQMELKGAEDNPSAQNDAQQNSGEAAYQVSTSSNGSDQIVGSPWAVASAKC